MSYNNEERIGVNAVAKIITEDFGWIFREQPVNDFGIDATVEITQYSVSTRKLKPTGKLIGLQIKSGKSYLKNETEDHYTFRTSRKHVNYWLGYSIAVIVIIYDKTKNTAYWEVVNSETIVTTRNSFSIYILKNKLLNETHKQHLINLGYFKGQHHYRLWQLTKSYDIINLAINKQIYMYVGIEDVPCTNSYFITLILTPEKSDDYARVICGHYFDDAFECNFHILRNMNLEDAINDVLPWTELYFNGIKFSEEMLRCEINSQFHIHDGLFTLNEISEIQNTSTLLELACYFSGAYFFRLDLSPNDLATCFIKMDSLLNKKLVAQENFYI